MALVFTLLAERLLSTVDWDSHLSSSLSLQVRLTSFSIPMVCFHLQDVRRHVRGRPVCRDGRADDRVAGARHREQLQHVLLAFAGALQTPEAPPPRAPRRGRMLKKLVY